jgi:hypothetical protein
MRYFMQHRLAEVATYSPIHHDELFLRDAPALQILICETRLSSQILHIKAPVMQPMLVEQRPTLRHHFIVVH